MTTRTHAQMLMDDGMSANLAQQMAAYRLRVEAERLRAQVKASIAGCAESYEERDRRWNIIRRLDDRISRREYRYRCASEGKPPVTTVELADWIRKHVEFWGIAAPDPAEVAGHACDHFDLWDEHGSIPQWVHGVCERTAPKVQMEAMRSRAFFVEKPIRYEPDGDVLWA